MHYSTPRKSSITHCPRVQSLKRAAEHRFLVSVYTDPRCCIASSWNHVKNRTPLWLHLSRTAGGRKRVYIHVAYLSTALLQKKKPPVSPLSTGVNTPGETNLRMTWKKAGFVPCEVILAPDPKPQNKQIHHPVRRFPTKTDTPPRRRSGTRRPSVCLPAVPRALSLACSAHLCRCAVDVRLRKNSERWGLEM